MATVTERSASRSGGSSPDRGTRPAVPPALRRFLLVVLGYLALLGVWTFFSQVVFNPFHPAVTVDGRR